jgi:hypothetical protein
MLKVGHTFTISIPILVKHRCSTDYGILIVIAGYDHVIHSFSIVI